MKCPHCQFDNESDARFCNKCGSKLEIICPECGVANQLGSQFCKKCGHDLTKLTEAPPVDYDQPQSYTPKFLADKILTTRSSIEGERKLVTVLFADVANYTAISEKLDPEEVHQIMDGCFKILMDEIHKYEGTINQFTGDGVMALFGAPVAHEDHAQRACYTALSVQKAMGEYGENLKKDTGVDFKMRVGLNSGPVIVGSIGDDLRMDYTAVGDTTNLAARMENAARPGSVLVTNTTHRLVKDFFDCTSIGTIQVKGKEEALQAYELVKAGEVETRFGAAVAKGLTRFVGRKNSMAALVDAFEKVKAGSGQVVGIVGEAGVGKSRLLIEFRNQLPQSEFTYLEGRCLHYGGSMPYLPMLDILRFCFEIKEGDREYIIKKKIRDKILSLDGNLKNLTPPFQALLSLKVDDEDYIKLEHKEKREKTFEAIRDLLIRMSQDKPLVVAIEDLHWIDKTTEEFLDYVIGWLASTHILVVLLYRPEYTHQWGSKSYYNRIGLDQLTTQSSAELVQAILEEGEIAPELRELILNRAAGNPLFMEEFTHTLIENGSIERKDEKYVLSGKISDIQVPDTIQGIIAARMDRLEDNLKRTMQLASVIGRDFAFRILQTITGMREELKSYLLNLQGLELIYEKNLFPELEYIFKHALTQEVAYNSLLHKRRKEIHEKIGRAIEQIYSERLEEFYEMLAYHYSKSENTEKAYQYLKSSGEKATQNSSLLEAFGFYKKALKVLTQWPDTEENKRKRIEVILLMATTMRLLVYPEDSVEILEEGKRLAEALADARTTVTINGLLGLYHMSKGQPLLARDYQERSFKEADKIQDVELVAPTAYDLCFSYFISGDYLKSADVAPKAIGLIEKTHREADFFSRPPNVYSGLKCFYGYALGAMGNFRDGEDLLDKMFSRSLEIRDLVGSGAVPWLHGRLSRLKGDGGNTVRHNQDSIKIWGEIGINLWLGQLWSCLGFGYHLLGDSKTALEHIEKGLKIQKDVGVGAWLSDHHVYLSTIYCDLGDLKKARHHVEQALQLSQKNHEKENEGLSTILLGRIVGKTEQSSLRKAEDYISQGINRLYELKIRAVYSVGYLYLGELSADAGQPEKALANLKKAESMFQEMGMDYWLAKTQEVLGKL